MLFTMIKTQLIAFLQRQRFIIAFGKLILIEHQPRCKHIRKRRLFYQNNNDEWAKQRCEIH